MRSIIVIPTYNEKESIEKLINKILILNIISEILIIDDNSPDRTGEIIDELSRRYKQIKVIHRERKLGIGSAYIMGFKHAINQGFDYVLTSDADFSHSPAYLPLFIKNMDNYDLIMGSRYVEGGKIINWGRYRMVLSKIANIFIKKMLNLKINDSTSGFRCYKVKALDSLGIDRIFSNGYAFLIEMTYYASRSGLKIKELPIKFVGRKEGSSKISRSEIIRALLTVFKLYLTDVQNSLTN